MPKKWNKVKRGVMNIESGVKYDLDKILLGPG